MVPGSERGAPLLSSREPGAGQVERGKAAPRASGWGWGGGGGGRRIGARASREDGESEVRVGGDLGQRTCKAETLSVIAGRLWCWTASILSWLGGTYSFAPVWRTGEGAKERRE